MSCRLVLLDLPEGSEFGFDAQSYRTGANFRGVKGFDGGAHLVSVKSVDRVTGKAGEAVSVLHYFEGAEVLVLRWAPEREEVEFASADDAARVRANLPEVDRHLGVVDSAVGRKWLALTSWLDQHALRTLCPDGRILYAATQFRSDPSTSAQRLQRVHAGLQPPCDSDGLPIMTELAHTKIHFSPFPTHRYPPGATPDLITKFSIDSTYVLDTVLAQYGSPDDQVRCRRPEAAQLSFGEQCLLAELQFAFVCFLFASNLDAFEQWKLLTNMLCTCDEGLAGHGALISEFISVLYYHVREVPNDFFVDIVSQNNFLVSSLFEFFSNVSNNTDVSSELTDKADKFRKYLTNKFKWDFTAEPDDYQPSVV